MYCAMVMPHLILARTRTVDYASYNKTIARQLDQWIKWDIDSMFLKAKTIQERMSKTKTKRSVDDYNEYDKYMLTGKFPIPFEVLQTKRKVVSFFQPTKLKRQSP